MSTSISDFLGEPGPNIGGLGQQHFAFLSAVRAMLCGWCGPGSAVPDGVSAIPFDKLANFTAHTWAAARSITEDDGFVPCPFEERAGVHGPGRALTRHRSEAQRYFLDVAFDLQQIVPERVLFDIDPWIDPKTGVPVPTDSRTHVRAGTPHPTRDQVASQLSPRACDLLLPLAGSLVSLDENQVRAIGTHRDAENTVAAIAYHDRRLARASAVVLPALENGEVPNRDVLRQMEISCSELRRKTLENEPRYAAAYSTILDDLPVSLARAAFEAVQRPSTSIWTDPRVMAARHKVGARVALVDFLVLVPQACSGSSWSEVQQERLVESLDELPHNDVPREVRQLRNALASGRLARTLAPLCEKYF